MLQSNYIDKGGCYSKWWSGWRTYCFCLTVASSDKKKNKENSQKIIKMIDLTLNNCSFTWTLLKEILKGFSWKLKTIKAISKIYLLSVLRFLIKFPCDPYYESLSWFMIGRVFFFVLICYSWWKLAKLSNEEISLAYTLADFKGKVIAYESSEIYTWK